MAWFTDNAIAVSIVHSGSKIPELQDLAICILHVCVSFGILLEMKWIRLNFDADQLIRIIYLNDYTLNDDVLYARFSIGAAHYRFPYNYYALLSCFNSRFFVNQGLKLRCFFFSARFWIPPSPSFTDRKGHCSFESV